MEEERCSWVTRAKFSPTVYLRSNSSGLPSITYDYKSDRRVDLNEKNLICESKPREPDSGSSKDAFQSCSCLSSVSEAKKMAAILDAPLTSSTLKTEWKSGNKLKDSKVVSLDSLLSKSSLQHGSYQSSSHILKDSDSQTVDFSFHPDVIAKLNPMEVSVLDSSDSLSCKSSLQHGDNEMAPMLKESISQPVDFSFNPDISAALPPNDSILQSSSCKSSPQHDHSRSLSSMPTDTISQTVELSFNPDTMTRSPTRDSNLIPSDILSRKSHLRHHRSQSLNLMMMPNFQHVDFSFHFDARTNSSAKNLDSSVAWFAPSKKKVDPRLLNSCLLSDLKELKSKPKQRSISPLPRSILSDAFKEAKYVSKRFSTPPHHRESKNNISKKNYPCNEQNRLQQISSGKDFHRSREKKETHRTRLFDSGVRVTAVETTEKWTVDLSELYFGARFAFGAHSRLYYGRYKTQPVAVKIIRLPDDDENGIMAVRLEKQFTRETTFLSHLFHRNVIKLAGACKKPPILLIITEYLSGGSLRAFLHKQDHNSLPLDKLISIALDVSRGMEYIHSQGVIHRDLKPENILFDHNFCVKIADFGVACEEAYCDVLEDDAGTYRWMAPEMIKHKPYGHKVDIYSFGLLLWEMITGSIPYEEMSPVQAAFAVVDKNLRPVIPADSPVVLRVLIEQCWSTVPEERPEFWQIVKVLEQFQSDLARGEELKQIQVLPFQDHKNKLLKWVEKLRPPKADSFRPSAPKR